MDAEKFIKELQNKKIPSVTILTGGEEYYMDKIIETIRNNWLANEDDKSFTEISETVTPLELKDALGESSFFSMQKVIYIDAKDFFAIKTKGKEDFSTVLAYVPPETKVVIKSQKIDKRTKMYKNILAIATVVECQKLKPYKVKPWLYNTAKEYGCSIDDDAVDLINEYLSVMEEVSLHFLAQEVEKLYLYAGSRKNWSKNDVENIFSGLNDVSAFALIKSMSTKDSVKAIRILHEEIKRGEHILKIAGLIAYQIRRLWSIKCILKAGGTREDVISKAGVPSFFVDEMIRESKGVSEEKIKNTLAMLSNISREVHLGGRGVIHLEEMIVEFCA